MLTVKCSQNTAIYFEKGLTINDCKIVANGKEALAGVDGKHMESLTINNAALELQGDKGAMTNFSGLTIVRSKITSPYNGKFNGEKHAVVDAAGSKATRITIERNLEDNLQIQDLQNKNITSLELEAKKSGQSFSIFFSGEFTTSVSDKWIIPVPDEFFDPSLQGKIAGIQVEANESTESRSGTVTYKLTGSNKSITIRVTQKGKKEDNNGGGNNGGGNNGGGNNGGGNNGGGNNGGGNNGGGNNGGGNNGGGNNGGGNNGGGNNGGNQGESSDLISPQEEHIGKDGGVVHFYLSRKDNPSRHWDAEITNGSSFCSRDKEVSNENNVDFPFFLQRNDEGHGRVAIITFRSDDGKNVAAKIIQSNSNGVEESVLASISISPNPFTHQIRILNPEGINASYEIVNLSGIVVHSGALNSEETLVDTTTLPKGLYIVRVKTSNSLQKSIEAIKY